MSFDMLQKVQRDTYRDRRRRCFGTKYVLGTGTFNIRMRFNIQDLLIYNGSRKDDLHKVCEIEKESAQEGCAKKRV